MVTIIFLFLTMLCTTQLIGSDFSLALELADVHYLKNKDGDIKPTVFLGEPFRLKAIINGNKQAPNDVTITGLEKFEQAGTSHHSSMSINNSKVSLEKTISYVLSPNEEGSFDVGPAVMKYEGTTITSNTVSVNVIKKTDQHVVKMAATEESEEDTPLWCTLTANKSEVFTEEPVTVTLSVYKGSDNAGIRGIQAPQFPNCTVKEAESIRELKKTIKNKTYAVVEKDFVIYPNSQETVSVAPAQVVYQVRKKEKKKHVGIFGNEFFSDFFDFGMEQKVAASNPLSITVKKVPPFDGQKKIDGIGLFESFTASVDKTNVLVNEPIKLTLALTGQANFDFVLQPQLTLPSELKSYDSKITAHPKGKSYEFILQIPKEGTWTVPPQSFHFFDTNKETYRTIETGPITVSATMPEGEHMTPLALPQNTPNPEVPESKETDINFIQEESSSKGDSSYHLPIFSFLLLILVIPGGMYMTRISTKISPRMKKLLRQKNTFVTMQAELTELIELNEPGRFYNLFISALAEEYKTPTSAIHEEWIRRQVSLPTEKKEAFIMFLNECAQYSFASKKMLSSDLKDFANKAHYWLLLIHKKREDTR